jgi:CRP/FNR family transcriptional regulator
MKLPSTSILELDENRVNDRHNEDGIFSNLPAAAAERLEMITSRISYPKGGVLFAEQQEARGVFILSSGRVKLSTISLDGRTLIVRIAEPGEVLGLAACVTGKPCELTAVAIDPMQAKFITRNDFLGWVRKNCDVACKVAQQLGESYYAAVAEMRSIGQSYSAGEKLARFFLDWCANYGGQLGGTQAQLTLTHQEIGEIIGSSRETVTRLFSAFKKKQIVEIRGSMLVINREDLEKISAS